MDELGEGFFAYNFIKYFIFVIQIAFISMNYYPNPTSQKTFNHAG